MLPFNSCWAARGQFWLEKTSLSGSPQVDERRIIKSWRVHYTCICTFTVLPFKLEPGVIGLKDFHIIYVDELAYAVVKKKSETAGS